MSSRAALFAVLLVLAGALAFLLRGRSGSRSPADAMAGSVLRLDAPGSSSAPEPVALDRERAAPVSEPARPSAPETARPRSATTEERIAELARTLDSPDWAGTKRALEELVAIGTPEALSVVLQHMAEGPHHTHEPKLLAELLADVEDPGIAAAAAAALQTCVLEAHDTWDVVPYADILIRHGGAAERQMLLELMLQDDLNTQLRGGIGESLAGIRDPDWGASLLSLTAERIRAGDPGLSKALLRGLAEWEDPTMRAGLLELAHDPSLDADSRSDTYSAWGSSLTPVEGVGEVLAEYRSRSSPDRALVFDALSGALAGLQVEQRRAAWAAAYPMIHEGLLSGDAQERLSALSILGDDLDDVPVETAAVLRLLQADPSIDARTRSQIQGYIRRIENRTR